MPIRAVIFDLMDVLILTGDRSGRAAYEARIGAADGALERAMFASPRFREAIAGRVPAEALWRDAARALSADPGEWRSLAAAFGSAHALNRDLVAFIRALRPRYRTAILTNTPSGMREWGIARFGLERAVDLIVVSAEEGTHKPRPEFYMLAAERLGVHPGEALFVDDEARYVAAAEAVGMRGVRFVETEQATGDIRTLLSRECWGRHALD